MFNETGTNREEVDEAEDHDAVQCGERTGVRRRAFFEDKDTPVETLRSWHTRLKLNLQPSFQRSYIWDTRKASRLIESLLLHIRLPVFYLAEEPDEKLCVVDGQQRLTSIFKFLDGAFPLVGLELMRELNGKRYRDLPPPYCEAIVDANLRLTIITRESDPDVKFEVFERLNQGAASLTQQELRNCVYAGPFNDLLAELAENTYMLRIMGSDAPHRRMTDRQHILRFIALWKQSHHHYRTGMKNFLNRTMEAHRHAGVKELAEMRDAFERAIELAWHVFGPNAFRRFDAGTGEDVNGRWEGKFSAALWDTLLGPFAFLQKPQVIPVADAIREEYLDLVTTDERFRSYMSCGTDTSHKMKYRAEAWRRRLEAIVTEKEPRCFSQAVKEALYGADPTCRICGQRIQCVDDSEIDHIEHYWRGGRTIPENGRLVHRYCNRARGGRE